MTTNTAYTSVMDAIHEVAITRPDLASGDGSILTDRAYLDALRLVPDEYQLERGTPRERFVAGVLANALAACRSAYVVALYALDS
jgi:hypothetical protein